MQGNGEEKVHDSGLDSLLHLIEGLDDEGEAESSRLTREQAYEGVDQVVGYGDHGTHENPRAAISNDKSAYFSQQRLARTRARRLHKSSSSVATASSSQVGE